MTDTNPNIRPINTTVLLNELASVLNTWINDDSDRALLFCEMGEALRRVDPKHDMNYWHSKRSKHPKQGRH